MKIVQTLNELSNAIADIKSENKTIGFVPTMGALHNGHKSLVERAVKENDYCVVSIFVNPTQFNNNDDLVKYPRNIEQDAALLAPTGCKLIFNPSPEEIYTDNELNNRFEFDFGGLDKVMEGKFRPGHFNGVVQIVSKFFTAVQPDKAYFGEKDFQQLSIIHRMNKIMNFGIEIVDCPIVREPSGLAMSSRNERLTSAQRIIAVKISQVLFESRNFVSEKLPKELAKWIEEQINAADGLEVEYVEIVDINTLQSISDWKKPSVCCVAVYCGDVRLIDNIRVIVNG